MAVVDLETVRSSSWLDAAPFRAHVGHLMSVGSLTTAELAVLAGLPAPAVHHLVHGWRGRPRRRIHRRHAHCLYSVTALDASLVRTRTIAAGRTRLVMNRLAGIGWSPDRLAELTGLTPGDVQAILDGRRLDCLQLVEIRVIAEARRHHLEDDLELPSLAARQAA